VGVLVGRIFKGLSVGATVGLGDGLSVGSSVGLLEGIEVGVRVIPAVVPDAVADMLQFVGAVVDVRQSGVKAAVIHRTGLEFCPPQPMPCVGSLVQRLGLLEGLTVGFEGEVFIKLSIKTSWV